MGTKKKPDGQIEKVITAFTKLHMPVRPKPIAVDIHSHCVLATLQDVIPPAERECVDGEGCGELVEKYYRTVFDSTKKGLHAELENILGQLVSSSMLRVDLESGNAIMIFNLTGKSTVEEK